MKVYLISIFMLCGINVLDAVNWQPGNWAMGCDFKGNDLSNAPTPGNQCSSKCQATPGCSHFVWSNWQGGTCWMKSGPVSAADAFDTTPDNVCGFFENNNSNQPLNKGAVLFSDDFNSQQELDQNWDQINKGDGFGNNELQFYQNNNQNAILRQGNLVIQARIQNSGGRRYTSAKLVSKKKFTYGIFEMRAKLPQGRGSWPGFWLLADETRPGWKWPDSGEIDIMEHVGYDPGNVHGTIHCKAFNGMIGNQKGGQTFVNNAFNDFHLYQVDWKPDSIRFFVDNTFYFQYVKQPGAGTDTWPYNTPFEIILNYAVGGNWGGVKGVDDSIFPSEYVIDYVKVYAN